METVEKWRIVQALEVTLVAAMRDAVLPRLTQTEYGELVALRTVARQLEIAEIDSRITALIQADKAATREAGEIYRFL